MIHLQQDFEVCVCVLCVCAKIPKKTKIGLNSWNKWLVQDLTYPLTLLLPPSSPLSLSSLPLSLSFSFSLLKQQQQQQQSCMWILTAAAAAAVGDNTPDQTAWATWFASSLACACWRASRSRWTWKVGKRQEKPGISWKMSNGCQPSPSTAVRSNTGIASETWVVCLVKLYSAYCRIRCCLWGSTRFCFLGWFCAQWTVALKVQLHAILTVSAQINT